MDVLLVDDATTSANWGDRAASAALMEMIRAVGGRIAHVLTEDELWSSTFGAPPGSAAGTESRARKWAIRSTPPILGDLRRRITAHLGNSAHISAAARLIPQRWEDFDHCAGVVLREKEFGWPVLLDALQRADVVMINGDQAMVGDGIVARTDLFLAYLAKRQFRRPVVIVNHTADFDHPNLRRIAHEVYPLFDDVVFRDQISAERCSGFCDGRLAADTGFWFEPAQRHQWTPFAGRPTYFDVSPNRAHFDPSKPYLCIGGSSLLFMSRQPVQIAVDFATLIDHIRSVYHGQIVLTAGDKPDQAIFELVASRLKLPLVGMGTPVQQAVDILGNADAFVGGRWHSSIFALRGGAPVVALSARTFKMQALLRSAGLPDEPFDVFSLQKNGDSLIRTLSAHLEGGDELRYRLRGWSGEQAEQAWENVDYLRAHASARAIPRWHARRTAVTSAISSDVSETEHGMFTSRS